MTHSRLKQHQLNLLGRLEAATLNVGLHLEEGIPSRMYWISGEDDEGNQILLWSAATSEGPRGGLNLADVLSDLLEIFRLTRDSSD